MCGIQIVTRVISKQPLWVICLHSIASYLSHEDLKLRSVSSSCNNGHGHKDCCSNLVNKNIYPSSLMPQSSLELYFPNITDYDL